jgi:hypothetical protein
MCLFLKVTLFFVKLKTDLAQEIALSCGLCQMIYEPILSFR